MTLAQARLLLQLLVYDRFGFTGAMITARACKRRGWCINEKWDKWNITEAGKAALREHFPEVIDLYETKQSLSQKLLDLQEQHWR